MGIVRGTTPIITFSFSEVNVSDIVVAVFNIKQFDKPIIEKDLSDAIVGTNMLSWRLTQEETFKLRRGVDADIICDWKLLSGVRGVSDIYTVSVDKGGKTEVI